MKKYGDHIRGIILCVLLAAILQGCGRTDSIRQMQEAEQVSCMEVKQGYKLVLRNSEMEEIYFTIYQQKPEIEEIAEGIWEISVDSGTENGYVFYYRGEDSKISDAYYHSMRFEETYVAYMENGTLILTDIFSEGELYAEMNADFAHTENPIDAVISIEKADDESLRVIYYDEENYTEENVRLQGSEEEITVKPRKPVDPPYVEGVITTEVAGIQGSIYEKTYTEDFVRGWLMHIDYSVPVKLQEELEDYFPAEEVEHYYDLDELVSMFYDNRTIEMGEAELVDLFREHGLGLCFHDVEYQSYCLRFVEITLLDGLSLYPVRILMQTWDDNYIYLQDITGPIPRKIREVMTVDRDGVWQLVVHSSGFSRDYIAEEELSFWEFRNLYWILAPMELEIDASHALYTDVYYPSIDRDELYEPTYYRDGIAYRSSKQPDIADSYIYRLGVMDVVEPNKSFRMVAVSDVGGMTTKDSETYIQYVISGCSKKEDVSPGEMSGMECTASQEAEETENGIEDDTVYGTYEGFLIQDEESLEKCMDDLQNHYQNGRVTLRIAGEMADLDTSVLAGMIWERDLKTEWEIEPGQEEEADAMTPTAGTEYAVRVCFENRPYQDNWAKPLLYRPEESGNIPACMQPFLSEEVRTAISEADMDESEYLRLFVKQDAGNFHYITYGFSDGGFSGRDDNDIGSCSHVFLWVSGDRADGTHVNQVLEIPMWEIDGYSHIMWPLEKDVNQDGEEDLLLRFFNTYQSFLWNKESGKYELFESLPDYITCWGKDGVVFSWRENGGSGEFCTKYELIDGEYQETQRVECIWSEWDGKTVVWEIREYRMEELVFSKKVEGSYEKERDRLYSEMPWGMRNVGADLS